jgi:signal transduction histidine kinase
MVRQQAWTRGPLADVGLAALTLAAVAAWGGTGLDTLGWVFAVAESAALCLRSRHPVPVAVFTLVACVVYYSVSEVHGPIWPAFLVALYTVAARARPAIAAVLVTVALIAFAYEGKGTGTPHLAGAAPFLLAGWLIAAIAVGGVVHNRRAFLREAERHAQDARLRREEELRLRAAEERLRIARELHDVLGHNISLINVQATAALHRLQSQPERAAPALTAIKASSKEALRELRATLGVLRQVDEDAPTGPASGLAGLSALVERAGNADLSVSLEIVGRPQDVPAEVGLAGYRIVQEALTNVSRHAVASTAMVRIRFDDRQVTVEIDDDGRGAPVASIGSGSGSGLRGMAERAIALGGEFVAGPLPGRGFRVSARLPEPVDAVSSGWKAHR